MKLTIANTQGIALESSIDPYHTSSLVARLFCRDTPATPWYGRRIVKQKGVSCFSVAPGPSGFLKVIFDRSIGNVHMQYGPDICFFNSHTEGGGGNHDPFLSLIQSS
ncbi:MAG: hypothetical protein U5K51_09380 [Flavobacteriaceae bacterium]|nr:hypothetical protein [Flavobacteriaceae bacterium]